MKMAFISEQNERVRDESNFLLIKNQTKMDLFSRPFLCSSRNSVVELDEFRYNYGVFLV